MYRVKLPHVQGKYTICFVLLFIMFSSALSAMGKKEEEKREIINNEFILCITVFDVSELPPGQRIIGLILQRELMLDLGRIHYRIRNNDEISRYEELAMISASHQAAVRLAAKRAERDALLFRGMTDWKYKKEIARIDSELRELEAAYKKAEEEIPLIAEKPLFIISEQNTAGSFPLPPEKGREEAFLKTNNADVFLEGRFRLFHERIFAEFRLFTRGASFIYEDSTIFSQEDLNIAADELKIRFLTALVNSPPAQLRLTSTPEQAQLEVNDRLVKSGDVIELAPGPVTVRATAGDHQSIVKEIELEGGDSVEIAFELKPFTMETLGIDLGGPGSSVYMGAMYLGGNMAAGSNNDKVETAGEIDEATDKTKIAIEIKKETEPRFFSVYVPVGQYRYLRMETEDGLTGEVIVKGTPNDEVRIITLQPRKLPGKNDKPVEDKRRKFYGAYGRFWIALPVAFFTYGLFQLYDYSNKASSGNPNMYTGKKTSSNITIGAWSVAGVFLAETLIRMGIYINAASKESIPFWE